MVFVQRVVRGDGGLCGGIEVRGLCGIYCLFFFSKLTCETKIERGEQAWGTSVGNKCGEP